MVSIDVYVERRVQNSNCGANIHSQNHYLTMKQKHFFTILLLSVATLAGAQKPPLDWFHLDPAKDGFPGLRTNKAYEGPLKGKTSQTVIVAVIDSGVDAEHEDLRNVMWTNPGEIAGNGKDDDGNGYIDDIHGWNFLGGKDGRNVGADNLEVVRLYRAYDARFKSADASKLSAADKKDYEKYKEYEGVIAEKRKQAKQNMELYGPVVEALNDLVKHIGKDPFQVSEEDVRKVKSNKPSITRATRVALSVMGGSGQTLGDVKRDLEEYYTHLDDEYNYNYNLDYNPRNIVGDNYADLDEKGYGNNDVKGPDATHGTHVAGIIGAQRNNNIGMDGVAGNVRIMSVRTVPNGDEHDKDVANAILYAVDNGALVINMSFGKGASPHKAAIDRAVRYAAKRDVLLIHGAGNDGQEIDLQNNFPNRSYLKKGLFGPKYAANWMEVGATHWKGGEMLAAEFSNYSSKYVDIFAPGVDIYSTDVDNQYRNLQGTSMAAPMVAGAAAVLRSYFPQLTAVQVKNILVSSSSKQNIDVIIPGGEDKVPFKSLSTTGGILDLEAAVRMAEQTQGKRKTVAP